MNQPETRTSLLLRIRDSRDRDAWEEFASIYRPAIIRLAQFKGLQNADAEDLAQQVLISVAKSIEDWKRDPSRATFRTWLNRVTHNAVLNAITRAAPDRASGNSKVFAFLNQSPACPHRDFELLTIEIRREVFRYAANEVCHEFQDETWQAFWRTAVEGQSVDHVARQLNKNRGSVYAARSRVMRRLKVKVQEFQMINLEQENQDD